ncbi:MAG TPA: hypothetical protein VMG41_03305 [Gemmatimonadales bacterium]|nr:hypothetical protein [Gemmatimonadales bacterium]
MDPNQIAWYVQRFITELLPYVVAAVGITLISVTPIGRAAISWLKGHVNRGRAAELSTEIERLHQELLETQERLDFAERQLLTLGPEPRPVPPAIGRPPVDRVPTPV